ncbi:MAG: hypothetical protein ABTS16_19195, partial [Candidatus Accumulibacter phosphatis]
MDAILHRSDTLDEAIISLLDPEKYETYDASERISASFLACTVSLEHARGLRALLYEGLPTPAISSTLTDSNGIFGCWRLPS